VNCIREKGVRTTQNPLLPLLGKLPLRLLALAYVVMRPFVEFLLPPP
jgi:hypothetical protein